MEERDTENQSDAENKGSDENRRNIDIYSVIFFMIIPIIIIGILTIKTVYVYKTISLIDKKDYKLICDLLEDSHWFDLGFSILGVAVSVWLGINISNLVDKRQIDKLNKNDYYGAAEPPVRCGESHLSGLTEPPVFVT